MKLRYTPKALADLEQVLDYIARHSPQGARRVQQRLANIIGLLPEHPYAGQKTNRPSLRRIVVVPYPYLVFYQVVEDEVIIIGVRHAARDPLDSPG